MNRLGKILAAIDFSPCSADAFRQACRIADWNRAELHAIHVLNIPAVGPAEYPFLPIPAPPREELEHAARRNWEGFVSDSPAKARAQFHLVIGSPRAEILSAVESLKPDLLVIGATSVLDRKRGIGSTAAACVRRADCKVLVVREQQPPGFRNIAAFLDFSATSREALEQAVRICAQDGASLHLVHLYPDPWHGMYRPEVVAQNMPDFEARMRQAVERRMAEFAAPLARELQSLKARYHAVQHDEHWNGQADGIGKFISEQGIDLAVLGVRSTWNARDFFMGTTAQRVCRDAACSILTVRPVEA
jgi:nucleotide-binding universal stress UspA family protein